ncbi:PD-(D/E)XK nuclease-like domain-containing protein [Arsenicibacter rosenii]|uniref:Putative exodeoxyribonuclease 8 PDDEXK-like domain-containing protein n=1 Tax=Arsenicibacter rosenii TaxID=1750698 RepID=A0A1S2VR15_9BACT|nr:PD-(D/E)XK nuclease-like domain-containing protein [Arsenicibacter rosenii]OIN61219.1 hypothetical protein BLX24_03925 [Arsenicibacter rosenii]
MNYRSIPRISNSDLTEFKNHIFGYNKKKPVAAFAFGTALHELILEPHKVSELPGNIDLALVQKLALNAKNDKYLRWIVPFSRKEIIKLWEDPATGLALKSKLDIVHKGRIVVDIKSTSCKSLADFLKSSENYDYDRQAAFYLDAIGAKQFLFVAVQKVAPFHIWIVQYYEGGTFIAAGRKKYKTLLREWKRRIDSGQQFKPSTWCQNPENQEGIVNSITGL